VFTATLTLTDDDNAAATRSTTVVVTGVGRLFGFVQVIGTDEADTVKIVRLANKRLRVISSFAPRRTFAGLVLGLDVRVFGGDDKVTVDAAVRQRATLDGGDGDDRLLAGGGSSLLLGGAGTDFLRGGAARDFLVAGTGPGVLRGGGGDDLMVAGRTLLEADRAALSAVLAEWRSPRGYPARVGNIAGTGSGPEFDARLNGEHFLKPDGGSATVFAAGEVLDAKGGKGRDWFFAELGGTAPALLGDLAGNEVVLDID
jgi:Ca2+-binding RTX toxin-like protein